MSPVYSPELGIEIAARVAEGKSLRGIAEEEGMPSLRTMMKWSSLHPEFARLLALARLDKAASMMDESITIADEPVADVAQAARNRVRVQARQYMAARLDPARWAEKIGIGGVAELPPISIDPIEGARRLAFVLQRAGQLQAQQQPAQRLQLTSEARVDLYSEPLPPAPSADSERRAADAAHVVDADVVRDIGPEEEADLGEHRGTGEESAWSKVFAASFGMLRGRQG